MENTISNAVQNFSGAMLDKLKLCADKPGWKDSKIHDLFCRLLDEVDELGDAISTGGYSGYIAEEAVDVANFAMMIFDNYVNGREYLEIIFPNLKEKEALEVAGNRNNQS